MLDIHSHILPGVDDGSKSLDESVKILEMMKEGYITYIATDSHSATGRVPMMNRALKFISGRLGNHYSGALIRNSEKMLEKITEASN